METQDLVCLERNNDDIDEYPEHVEGGRNLPIVSRKVSRM